MKIQQITPKLNSNNQQQNTQQPKFTGLLDSTMRFFDVNQAWGATAVDFSCMVAPRTLTDFTRGPQAGIETLRREASGTVNHSAVGLVYGPLAGALLATAINNRYGVNAQKVYADAETFDMLAKPWHDVLKPLDKDVIKNGVSDNELKSYARKIADMVYNGEKSLTDVAKDKFTDTLALEMKTPSKANRELLRNTILSDFGKEKHLSLKESSGKFIVADLNDIIDNSTSVSKVLNSKKVVESFKEALKFEDAHFAKAMKQLGLKRSLLGLGIASAIGCGIQPFNIYLTKKKTGSDGFVGVDGREKDKTFGFKVMKALTATAFGAGVYSFITAGKLKGADFLKNIQYKGITPTLKQFMLVYGVTIMSRFMVARDKDELREASVKDTLGFLCWLIFPGFVSKGALKLLDKSLINRTRDGVLFEGLKKAGISTIDKQGKALSFKNLRKILPASDKLTRTRLRHLNIAQIAGYAFSGLVLGLGIPKLNIYMTKQSEQKRAKERAMNPGNSEMLKPENIAFLSSQMNFTSNKMLGK